MDSIMTFKDITGKKYIVRLSKEERSQLQELIGKGTSPAKLQLKAADIAQGGCVQEWRRLER
jgi:hypothetical protein